MDKFSTNELINFICDTFGKPTPNDKKLQFYYDELYWMDEAALDSLKEYFRKLESCPTNIAKEARAAYTLWVKDNPQQFKQTKCAACKGRGMLHYLEYDPHLCRVYHYVGRCPDCENWRGQCGESTPAVRAEKLLNAKPLGDPFSDADEYEAKTRGRYA